MSRRATAAARPSVDGGVVEVPAVGLREPCPCGSGRRYKACHGRAAARATPPRVPRPFAGLPREADWVALRELVPAGTAALPLRPPYDEHAVTLATVLPLSWAAMSRSDGRVFVSVQAGTAAGDLSRDLAAALLLALDAAPGTPVPTLTPAAPGAPRLQDLVDPDAALEVVVHDGFDFWLSGVEVSEPEVAASLERANAAVVPTTRLQGVESAYWSRMGERSSLRWVLPYDEEPALDAMARAHAAGGARLGEGTRFLGSYRAAGLVVPVWDVGPDLGAQELEQPAAAYAARLADAMAATGPLTGAERDARAGLLSRQLTLR